MKQTVFEIVTNRPLTASVYEMTLKGAFYYHYYENFYTLAYIDKMWGIMRKKHFLRKSFFNSNSPSGCRGGI